MCQNENMCGVDRYNSELFSKIEYCIKNFLYHLEAYRVINANIDELPGEREFWVYTNDAHLKCAALSWCKILSSDSEEIHWKKILCESDYEDWRERFLRILEEDGISESKFKDYMKEMRYFRNKYISHEGRYKLPVPLFNKAKVIVICLDKWLREVISPDIFDAKTVDILDCEWKAEIEKTVKALIKVKED